jgi:16S rRNA (adenine1518-N6/adenine1519-N6)-dimethyltransferase
MAAKRGNPPVLKRFGQHFLVDQLALADIARAVDPSAGDTIVEIGPGRGALTEHLATFGNPVVAVEIDRALAAQLQEKYRDNENVQIVEEDFLEADMAAIARESFVVVGNVPYYITTPIIFRVLQPPLPKRAVFLVQREVAERIVASPGSAEYGALTVNVQAIADAEIVRRVPAGAFRPPPKVESAVIRITPRADPLVREGQIDEFRKFVQGLFGMRRKQLANSLRSVSHLDAESAARILNENGIDPRTRPESLSPAQLVRLMHSIKLRPESHE